LAQYIVVVDVIFLSSFVVVVIGVVNKVPMNGVFELVDNTGFVDALVAMVVVDAVVETGLFNVVGLGAAVVVGVFEVFAAGAVSDVLAVKEE